MVGAVLMVLALLMGGVAVAGSASAAMSVTVVNTGGTGVASRTAPSLGATNGYGAPAGASVTTQCWAWGDAVGPYANRLWWLVTYSGRQFYVADRYLSTPNAANQPPAGQPQCGASSAAVSSSSSSSGDAPAVWIGSPINAHWSDSSGCAGAVYPSGNCSLPSVHHYSTGNADWATDLQDDATQGKSLVGQQVILYAAPQNTSVPVTATIEAIDNPCGSTTIDGQQVVVRLSSGSTSIGSVTYAHINPMPGLAVGQTINRWGTVLGTVGDYKATSCWTGPHLHLQMYSTHHYACYNRGYAPGQALSRTNFVGFIGGNFASGPRQACP